MTRALALICCAASFLLSHTASARPSRVALTQIEGDASGDVHDAVAEALEDKALSLIASREVNRAVDRIGDISDLTEKDFKKLASELDADAVVAGKLDKVGTAKTLKFRLFVHKKMAKGFTVSFKDAKSEKFRTLLHDKILDKIGAGSGGGDDEEDARPARKKKAAEDEEDPLAKKDKKAKKSKDAKADADDDDARPAKKTRVAKAEDDDAKPARKKADADDDARPAKKKADADDDARPARKKADADDDTRPAKKKADADDDARAAGGDDAKAKPGDDDDPAPRKAKKRVAAADDDAEVEATAAPIAEPARGANRAALRLDVGASVMERSFKFNARQIPGKPLNTSLSPVPGARLDGEVYPLALTGSQGVAANLGVGFEYDKTLSLHVNIPRDGMPALSVPAKQSHYTFGLRYRLAFGRTETSPTLTLGVDYAKQLFSTDLSATGTDATARATLTRNTPETEYTMIDPGAIFRLPVTRMVAFALGGRGLVITNAGPIQKATSYGKARVYGAEGLVALDIALGQHFGLRFSGEFSQIGFTFLGGGALTDVDGNGQPDVGGLADRSFGGAATLTLLY